RSRLAAGRVHEGAAGRHAQHGSGARGRRRVTIVAAGFEPVAEEFFRTLGEGGAAFAAVVDGEPVVDVWGGDVDGDTLYLVFSGTKGLVAVCLLLLVERGELDLEAPVARYWPGFGEPDILVWHVVSHTAGLPGLRRGIGIADLLDGPRFAAE